MLIFFALCYIVPMYLSNTLSENTLFDVYPKLSFAIISIISVTFFVINLVVGIANIRRKNIAIGVLTVVSGGIALVNILLAFLYIDSYADGWGYVLFGSILCQIVLSVVSLILNRKKESADLRKHSIVLSRVILLLGAILVIFPWILLVVNKNNLMKAYAVLIEQGVPHLFITWDDDFYDINGNLLSKNDYRSLDSEEINATGFHIITAEDNDHNLWIVDYTGKKLVRLYDVFTDDLSDFIKELARACNIYSYSSSSEDEINCLTLEKGEENYLKFTSDDNDITIEVEIDKTQLENDTSFLEVLSDYYESCYDYSLDQVGEIAEIEGVDLGTLYQYKKNYYLTYQDNERIPLDCHNLLIDYHEGYENYVLFLYKNGNIPFYDEGESGYYDLEGTKHSFDKQYLVYDTLDNYCILYNTVNGYFYLSNYHSNNKKHIPSFGSRDTDYSETFVYTDDDLYTIRDGQFGDAISVRYTINTVDDSSWFTPKINSVYDYYLIP